MPLMHPFTRQRCQQKKQQQQERQRLDTTTTATKGEVVGSVENNSNAPYKLSPYERQRTIRINKKEFYIRTFLQNAIQNNRVVIFAKNKTDPLCKKVEQLFLTNVNPKTLKSDMIVYHLDEMPCNGGVQIQKYLMKNYDTSTTDYCYVFVHGEHVPLSKLAEQILASSRTEAMVGKRLSVIDDSQYSSILSTGSHTGGYDNSSWFYPSEE